MQRIRQRIRDRDYEVTVPHFLEEMLNDDLQMNDIEAVILSGRIRRRFTDDPRGIRYEVVGPTADGRRVAVICRLKETGTLLLITTYVLEPGL